MGRGKTTITTFADGAALKSNRDAKAVIASHYPMETFSDNCLPYRQDELSTRGASYLRMGAEGDELLACAGPPRRLSAGAGFSRSRAQLA